MTILVESFLALALAQLQELLLGVVHTLQLNVHPILVHGDVANVGHGRVEQAVLPA